MNVSAQYNRLLTTLRIRQHLTQQQLADLLGTTPLTVSRWEREITTPSPFYRQKLSAVFGQTEDALGLTSSGEKTPLSQSVPPATYDYTTNWSPVVLDPAIPLALPQSVGLVGRDEILHEIELCFQEDLPHQLALYGLPGVGKTTLAAVAASELRETFPDGILWAGLGPKPNIKALLARWASLLGITNLDHADVQGLAFAIRSALGQRRFLLVVDDVWRNEDALALKVGGPGCVYLITTRLREVATYFAAENVIQVRELDHVLSLKLLRKLAPNVVKSHPQAIEELAEKVGGLPLALTLVGNWLRAQGITQPPRRIAQAVTHLQQIEARLQLAELQASLEHHTSLSAETPLSLQAVIAVSVLRLRKPSQKALFALSAFPAKANSCSEEAALFVANCTTDELDELVDAGLLEVSSIGKNLISRYTMHPTISDYAYLQRQSVSGVKERLVHYYTDFVENSPKEYEVLELEMSNIFVALQSALEQSLHSHLIRLIIALFPFLLSRGLYEQAKHYLEFAEQYARNTGDPGSLARSYRRRRRLSKTWGIPPGNRLLRRMSDIGTSQKSLAGGKSPLHHWLDPRHARTDGASPGTPSGGACSGRSCRGQGHERTTLLPAPKPGATCPFHRRVQRGRECLSERA